MDAGSRDIGDPGRAMRHAGPALVALAFAALCAWTYGTWPDVLIDFGRELYLPWRIVEGDVLYRDIASLSGPLSPYVNAAWFAVAGAHVQTLFLANLVVLTAFTALSYGVLRAVAGPFAATLATIVFLCTCAFGQQRLVGNYNFVAPYATDLTHGVLLGVAALAALWRGRSGRVGWPAVAGACAGLALLTKPECGVAAVAGLATALLCATHPRRAAAAAALGVALPPAMAVALFAQALPWGAAIAAVATPWTALLASHPLQFLFYRQLLGIDQPITNVVLMLAWTGLWWLALAPALALTENARAEGRAARRRHLILLAAYAVGLLAARRVISWDEAVRPLPIVMLVLLGLALRDAVARRTAPSSTGREGASPDADGCREASLRAALTAGFAMFSLVLLAKLGLRPRLTHYGFALAAPALMLGVAALAGLLPAALAARGGRPAPLRIAALALTLAMAAGFLAKTQHFTAEKTVVVGKGRDSFSADARGRLVNEALVDLSAWPADATIAVLPEGATINVLARRRNPTPFVTLLPLEMSLFGEATVIAAFRRAPPDGILLVHKSTADYGLPFFGRDYGARLMDWVRANYDVVRTVGKVPFREEAGFGIQILRRRLATPGDPGPDASP